MTAKQAEEKLKKFSKPEKVEILALINSAMDAQADYIINNGAKKYLAEREAWRNLK